MANAKMSNVRLSYFGGRGRAEALRYLLSAGGVAFDDRRVERADWPKMKGSMPAGQVPVLEFDMAGRRCVLYQSAAIAEFVAKQTGLYPSDALDAAQSMADYLTVFDFHEAWVPFYGAIFSRDMKKAAEEWQKIKAQKFPAMAGLFEKRLTGKRCLVGDRLSWADIMLADIIHRVSTIHNDADALKDYPNLKKHCTMVHDIPGIREYVEKRQPKTVF